MTLPCRGPGRVDRRAEPRRRRADGVRADQRSPPLEAEHDVVDVTRFGRTYMQPVVSRCFRYSSSVGTIPTVGRSNSRAWVGAVTPPAGGVRARTRRRPHEIEPCYRHADEVIRGARPAALSTFGLPPGSRADVLVHALPWPPDGRGGGRGVGVLRAGARPRPARDVDRGRPGRISVPRHGFFRARPGHRARPRFAVRRRGSNVSASAPPGRSRRRRRDAPRIAPRNRRACHAALAGSQPSMTNAAITPPEYRDSSSTCRSIRGPSPVRRNV